MKRNKIRFIVDIQKIVLNVLFILTVIVLVNFASSAVLGKKEYQTKQVTVMQQDTLWKIAKKICNNNTKLNINSVIEDIKEINSMDTADILVGQVLDVPIYE